jgi:small subunit ribosomal protein S3
MGQKINPIAFRISAGGTWKSRWFGDKKSYPKNLLEDLRIRKVLLEKLKLAGVTSVEIDRLINKVNITIYVSRPGMVIGRGGAGTEELRKILASIVTIPEQEKNIHIDVVQVNNPDLSASLVAAKIASELERRLPHRRVAKKTIERVMASGAKGVRVALSGRIEGAEIARKERFSAGKIPLGTMRADIDYASVPALTKFGYIGVKVWIYKE